MKLIIPTTLLLISVVSAHATTDVYFFKDVMKPGGHARSKALKQVDIAACSPTGNVYVGGILAFEKCMKEKGWALDRIGPDPKASVPRGTTIVYDDINATTGKPRGDAVIHADKRSCGRTGAEQSEKFKQCMLQHGWRLAYIQHGAPVRYVRRQAPESDSNSSSSDMNFPTSLPEPPPPSPSLPDITPPAIYEPPPPVDIHPFCPNPIC